jgi:hypothetical protein
MRLADVPRSAIVAALAVLEEFAPIDIGEHQVAAIIAAAFTGTEAERSAEWLATTVAQREHAETAARAILHQTDLIQQIVHKVLGIGDAPTGYEVWRDAMTLAVHERSYIDADGIMSSGLLARAAWFHNELNLGPRTSEFYGFEQQCRDLQVEVRALGDFRTAALNIHRPCHAAEARSVGSRDSTMADCARGHYENTETPECIGCGYGSCDQTTEWPCATAQALGATR